MAKRFSESEDMFIHTYFGGMGAVIGPHDLGRSEKSTSQRAVFLKLSGAWAALDLMKDAHSDYRQLTGRLNFPEGNPPSKGGV